MNMTFADAEVRRQARLVQRLAVDLERLRLSGAPSPDELALAPLIEDWRLVMRPEPALQGLINGHPNVSGPAVTSGLFILDRERGFARTLSRYYQLGSEYR